MTTTKVRPLDEWPRERRRSHDRSPFSSAWGDTVDLLNREIAKLGASTASILVDTSRDQIRVDGTMPLANAKIGYPGVVVAFESREHGPLKYISDRYGTWQDNVRAIALGLEALRKVDRYGITSRGEQYQGWAALPAPSSMEESTAESIIRVWAQDATGSDVDMTLYKRARARAHPDVHNGSRAGWDDVEEAAKALGLTGR